jgi:hypothetical protein
MKISNNKKIVPGETGQMRNLFYSASDKATSLKDFVDTNISVFSVYNDAEILMYARQLESKIDEIRDHLNKNYIWD